MTLTKAIGLDNLVFTNLFSEMIYAYLSHKESLHDVMANTLSYNIVVSQIDLHLCYYISFRTNKWYYKECKSCFHLQLFSYRNDFGFK